MLIITPEILSLFLGYYLLTAQSQEIVQHITLVTPCYSVKFQVGNVQEKSQMFSESRVREFLSFLRIFENDFVLMERFQFKPFPFSSLHGTAVQETLRQVACVVNLTQIHFIVLSLSICFYKMKGNTASASSNVYQCFQL